MRFSAWRRLVQAFICALIFFGVSGLYTVERAGHAGRTLSNWEYTYRDAVTARGRFNPPDGRLLFLGIDSTSVSLSDLDLKTLFADVEPGGAEHRALNLIASGWPWSREVYGLLVERLLHAGARAVVFDLLFPKPAPGDEAFQAAFGRYPGRVFAGSNFVFEVVGPGRQAWALDLPSSSVVPDSTPQNPAIGYVNFWPGFNGIIRSVQYRTTLEQLEGGSTPAALTPEVPASLAARVAASLGVIKIDEPFRPHFIRFSGPS